MLHEMSYRSPSLPSIPLCSLSFLLFHSLHFCCGHNFIFYFLFNNPMIRLRTNVDDYQGAVSFIFDPFHYSFYHQNNHKNNHFYCEHYSTFCALFIMIIVKRISNNNSNYNLNDIKLSIVIASYYIRLRVLESKEKGKKRRMKR